MKSSPPDPSFAGFLRRALDAIQAEVPWAYAALVRAMGAWATTLVVDDEPATVSSDGPDAIAVVSERRPASGVVCTTTTRVIVDLIAGRETLLEAVEGDRLELVGGIDALLVWYGMLDLFLHGAVRAPSFERLLSEFKGRLQDRRERV